MRVKLAVLAAVALMAFALTLPAGAPPAAAAAQHPAEALRAMMGGINDTLTAANAGYRVDYAEYITADGSHGAGQTVFFNNRGNKQLTAHFVPGDPRRGGGSDITYIVDQAEGAVDGLTTAQTTAAIDRAMATWEGVNCSNLPVTKLADIPGLDLGVVEFQSGLGGSPFVFADLTHAGWLPGGLLDPNVIAVTFTFVFINPDQTATDINNDGKSDVAFREILYNNAFAWAINGNVDVETIALHEAGHGLSQGHFGAVTQTISNGKFHFSPRAVMNAAYTGVQQGLAGTDNAGHCSIWGSWPNN